MTSLKELSLSSKSYGDFSIILNKNSLESVSIGGNNVYGNFENIDETKISALTYLSIESSNIYGDISLFSNGSLVNFNLNNAKNIIGNIASLPNKEKQTDIQFYNSGISGALEDYVSSAISSGKTTATDFRMSGTITQLTFGGIKQDISGLVFAAPCYVSWDNTGKIAVKSGQYGVANTTHVYCKGYSQEEAEAAFPGKTIIRVDA